MSGLTWHIGDTRKVLATLPPGTVDLVLTSPPFLALRSYLPADHPDKADEIGAEATPGAFIDTLLDVVEACEPLLAPHGSLCFELGDTYAGSGGACGDYGEDGLREGQPAFKGSASKARPHGTDPMRAHSDDLFHAKSNGRWRGTKAGWPTDKSLCLIPELFRVALVYGVNPLTGRTTPRWRARNVIRWCRPNPPVGALGDKFRPATSEMVVVCKSRSRYFDLDAVRLDAKYPDDQRHLRAANQTTGARRDDRAARYPTPPGAPPLDWWEIPTQGYPGAHYATWPKALLLRPIRAMCPERVCRTCGEPSRRISAAATTLGWTDCGHGDWRPGLVLDPFAGSGTTLDVAHGHGRHATGVDIDARNLELAQDRLGMFGIDVVDHRAVTDAV